jgi:ribosome-associated protein
MHDTLPMRKTVGRARENIPNSRMDTKRRPPRREARAGGGRLINFRYITGVDNLIFINSHTAIPSTEITFRFSRSGGPGGQNVNKVETKVELLFDVAGSAGLTEDQKQTILAREKNRIDSEGILRVTAQESRSQFENREAAVEKFVSILAGALAKRKKRVKTRASRASKEKRIEGKKLRGKKKQMRGRVDF